MVYGYTRISTKHQSLERQIRNIKSAYPEAYIIQEAYTGTKIDRPNFSKLLCRLAYGDIVVFDSVSRMSRNAEDGFKLYEELFNKGIDLIFINEPQINTTTYKAAKEKTIPLTDSPVDYILSGINQYLMELARQQIALAFEISQKESDDLHIRTKQGLLTAKLNGKVLGHKKNTPLIHKKTAKIKESILKYSKDFYGALSDCEVIKLSACSRKTYYKYKKILLESYKL